MKPWERDWGSAVQTPPDDSTTPSGTSPMPGMLEQGNLNPWKRSVLHNPDGSYSTTSSMSFDEDGKEVLVPTVVDGKRLSQQDAIAHYRKTGEHLGKFATSDAADKYAKSLHEAQARGYDSLGNPLPGGLSAVAVQGIGAEPQAPPQKPWDRNWGDAHLPPEERKPEGGLLRNLAAGTMEAATGTGALLNEAINPIRKVQQFLAPNPAAEGQEHLAATQHMLNQGLGAVDLNPEDVSQNTLGERVMRGVGSGGASALLPIGAPAAAAKAVPMITKALRAIGDVVTGGAAGAGATVAQEAAPDALKPLAGLAGGLGSGATVAGATRAARGAARAAKPVIDPLIARVSDEAAQHQAAAVLAGRATDADAAKAALDAGSVEIVPGSAPTTFQQTGDVGLGALERELANKNPAEFTQRAAEQNTARREVLSGIQPEGDTGALPEYLRTKQADQKAAQLSALGDVSKGGNPADVSTFLNNQFRTLDQDAQKRIDDAMTKAQAKTAGVAPKGTVETHGEALRTTLQQAEDDARASERGLWQAVDPDGDLTGNLTHTATEAKAIAEKMPKTAKPMAGEEAAIFAAAKELPAVAPVGDLIALRSRVSTEMRNELIANGKSPTYARLTQLRGAIQKNLTDNITQQVANEAKAVSKGTVAPTDTTASRIQGWVDDYYGKRGQAETGTGRAEGAPSVARAGATETAGANGTGLSPEGRPGNAPSAEGLSPDAETAPIKQYTRDDLEKMDADALDRMVFGHAEGDRLTVSPDDLKIKYLDDLENPEDRFKKSGLAWARSVDLTEPVELGISRDGSLELLDGHHRYFAAKKLGKPLNAVIVKSDGKPIDTILSKQNEGAKFTTTPGAIAEDHAADVSRLENEAMQGAASKLTPGQPVDVRSAEEKAAKEAARTSRTATPAPTSSARLPSSNSLVTPPPPTAGDMARSSRVEKVPLSQVRGTQPKMDWQRFNAGDHPPPMIKGYEDKPVAVKREDGEYLIFDGHHRAARAISDGKPEMEMHVIDAKSYAPEFAGRKSAPSSMSDDYLLRELGASPKPVPGIITPTFDEAAQQRLGQATEATKERARTFGLGPASQALRKAGASDLYRLPEARVPEKFFHPGPTGYADMQALYKAVGEDKALPIIQDYAALSLQKAAVGDDGILNPAKFSAWRNRHAESLRALPEKVRQQFSDASQAAQVVKDATRSREVALADAQSGALARVMNAQTPEDVTRTIGGIFGTKTAVADMRTLARAAAKDPFAKQGLRQSVLDHITEKYTNPLAEGTILPSAAKTDQFQAFMRQNRAALETVFTPEEINNIQRVASEMRASAAPNVALAKVMKADSPEEVTRAIGRVFGSDTGVSGMRALVKATEGDRAARNGLRKAVMDYIDRDFISNTEAGASGQELIKADRFQTFVKKNEVVLNEVLTPEEVGMLQKTAQDIQRSKRNVKIPGQSNTTQDAYGIFKNNRQQSQGARRFVDILAGGVGSALGGGWVSAVLAGAGADLIQSMRAAGIDTVDQLVTKAMLNPEVARELLKKAPTKSDTGSATSLARALRRSAVAGGVSSLAKAQQSSDHREKVQHFAKGGLVEANPVADKAEKIDHIASTAQQPTEAQAKAGNYRKAHISLHGMKIAIETPKGAERRGTSADGKPWSNVHQTAHYGYLKGTDAADSQSLDVYVGPRHDSKRVFVVDQHEPKTGKFDETKSILGATSPKDATAIYDAGFSDGSGPSRRKAMTEMHVNKFKKWAKSRKSDQPASASA